jgi:hypothetical protein
VLPPRARYAPGRLHSDNETRRPGAQNYTGASVPTTNDPARPPAQHSLPSSPGVSMMGDDFRSRTGSPTTGPIPTRAPPSNEDTVRKFPIDRGPLAPRR